MKRPIKSAPKHSGVIAYVGATSRPNDMLAFGEFAAKALGTNLTLIDVVENGAKPGELPDPIASNLLRRAASKRMAYLADNWTGSIKDISTITLEGCPADQLCMSAKNQDIDLTIINSRLGNEAQNRTSQIRQARRVKRFSLL